MRIGHVRIRHGALALVPPIPPFVDDGPAGGGLKQGLRHWFIALPDDGDVQRIVAELVAGQQDARIADPRQRDFRRGQIAHRPFRHRLECRVAAVAVQQVGGTRQGDVLVDIAHRCQRPAWGGADIAGVGTEGEPGFHETGRFHRPFQPAPLAGGAVQGKQGAQHGQVVGQIRPRRVLRVVAEAAAGQTALRQNVIHRLARVIQHAGVAGGQRGPDQRGGNQAVLA